MGLPPVQVRWRNLKAKEVVWFATALLIEAWVAYIAFSSFPSKYK